MIIKKLIFITLLVQYIVYVTSNIVPTADDSESTTTEAPVNYLTNFWVSLGSLWNKNTSNVATATDEGTSEDNVTIVTTEITSEADVTSTAITTENTIKSFNNYTTYEDDSFNTSEYDEDEVAEDINTQATISEANVIFTNTEITSEKNVISTTIETTSEENVISTTIETTSEENIIFTTTETTSEIDVTPSTTTEDTIESFVNYKTYGESEDDEDEENENRNSENEIVM